MTWIRVISEAAAEGDLRGVYGEILQRSGAASVLDSRKAMSLRPRLLQEVENLAQQVTKGATSLGRFREELIAVIVSARLECAL